MEIKMICIGKIKEKYIEEGIKEYIKRLQPFCSLTILELKEMNTNDIQKNIEEEGKNILNVLKDEDEIITLEIEGKQFDSITFANKIQSHFTYRSSPLVFVIGGSNGLSEEVKKRSHFALSFSLFTFPHQLMRLIFLEQLYRAMTIIHHHKYHK